MPVNQVCLHRKFTSSIENKSHIALCRAVVAVMYLLDAISEVSKNQTAQLYMRLVRKELFFKIFFVGCMSIYGTTDTPFLDFW